MSAKKKNMNRSGKRTALWVIMVFEIVILVAGLLVWWAFDHTGKLEDDNQSESTVDMTSAGQRDDSVPPVEVKNGGLRIVTADSYAGAYMEDGTDEEVSNVLMLVVTNEGDQAIQYAEITLPTENGNARFKLTTLPAGESCLLLEQTRMAHTGNEDISKATVDNVVLFQEPLSLCEDVLKFQALDGDMNVINISGEEITGDIVIYYKNAASDLYHGGITYRVRLTGGMRFDEIKQLVSRHFSVNGSKIMFVTIG